MKLKSYKKCYCGVDCYNINDHKEGEPCWGEVHAVSEVVTEDDSWYIHACEGHAGLLFGDEYTKTNKKEDL